MTLKNQNLFSVWIINIIRYCFYVFQVSVGNRNDTGGVVVVVASTNMSLLNVKGNSAHFSSWYTVVGCVLFWSLKIYLILVQSIRHLTSIPPPKSTIIHLPPSRIRMTNVLFSNSNHEISRQFRRRTLFRKRNSTVYKLYLYIIIY